MIEAVVHQEALCYQRIQDELATEIIGVSAPLIREVIGLE